LRLFVFPKCAFEKTNKKTEKFMTKKEFIYALSRGLGSAYIAVFTSNPFPKSNKKDCRSSPFVIGLITLYRL